MTYLSNLALFKNVSMNESRSLITGLFSIFLYTMVSLFMTIYEVDDVFIKLLYFASVSFFPIMLLIIQNKCFLNAYKGVNDIGKSTFIINLLFFIFLTASMLGNYTIKYVIEFQYLFIVLYFLIFCTKFYKSKILDLFFDKMDTILVFSLSVTIAVAFSFSLYSPFLIENIHFFKEMIQAEDFKKLSFFSIVLILGVAFIGWVFFNKKIINKKYEKLTLLVCFLPILLFDIFSNFDIEHYNAYLGPAIAVLNGKIPLIDVFCQYGLSYLVFTLGYIFFPNNYVVASAIVSVLNVICWIVLLLILRKMIKNPLYFSVIAITHLFGSAYILVHSTNLLPSTLCMRYFPTILLSYCLLSHLSKPSNAVNDLRPFRADVFNGLALLSIVWNIETLVSLCIIYGAYLWIVSDTLKMLFKRMVMLLLLMVFVYLICAVVYLILFHEVPNYGMYLRYIYAYINPYIKSGGVFLSVSSEIYKQFFFWVVIAVMHLVAFVCFLNYRFCDKDDDVYIKKLLFFNVVCITFLVYFILQPSLFSVINSGYPSFILMFSILVMEQERTRRIEFKFCSKFLLCILVFFFYFMAVKSVFIVHKNFYKNGDILYSFFHKRGFTIDRFLYNLKNFCSNKSVSPGAGPSLSIEENTCKRNTYHQELYDVMEKWYPGKKEVLLFHRDSIEVLMEHKKINKILVNPANDSIVEALNVKTIGWVEKKIKPGDIVVVEKDLNVLPIEYKVLLKMADLFIFKLLEATPHLRVFELLNKDAAQKSDLSFPITIRQSIASFSYLPRFYAGEPMVGVPAIFDKDKNTIWSVKNDILKKMDTFWIWMDAGALFWIDDIKIWRKIDFRKPDYVAKNAFEFLHDFNIELSEDNKQWFMVDSEKGLNADNRYYYESKIDRKKARYIRLNFFVNNANDLSISEVEVFGNKVIN